MLNELRNRNTAIIAVVALVVGILFGLVVLGWGPLKVDYVDGNPSQLAANYKQQYMQMVADSYAIDQDKDVATKRLAGFSVTDVTSIMSDIRNSSTATDPQKVRIQRLADTLGVTIPPGKPPVTASGGNSLQFLIYVLIGLALIAAGLYFFRQWQRESTTNERVIPLRPSDRTMPTERAATPVAPVMRPQRDAAPIKTAEVEAGAGPLLGHFVTTYKLGDDGYDTSFSIETPTGEFLGECGVGISDVVGEGPQKVTAFEVWLFDKNDIKTVTKVLMSDYAYNNEVIRKKLAARGDAVLAGRGREIVLETDALKVSAILTDQTYGSDGAPQSYFSKLTMELAPTIKSKAPA